MNDNQQLTVIEHEKPDALMRRATDVAGVCREIVIRTALQIKGRKFVRVEGWQAIAAAHGCVLSIENVNEDALGNITSVSSCRRADNGVIIAEAEGYVGVDEPTWANRPKYARRAMAQTRAMSRVARSAFAHVVVLIDANLSTTPAEEVPEEGFIESHHTSSNRPESCPIPKPAAPAPKPDPKPTPAAEIPVDDEPPQKFKVRWMELLKPIAGAALEYYIKTGRLLETESLDDLPLRFVPKSKDEADKMIHAIQAFMDGDAPDQEVPPKPKVQKPSTALCITGWLKHVTKKETKRPGSYRYGLLITEMQAQKEGGTWLNTFSDTDGAKAEGLKGQKVIAWYNEGDYGNDLVDDGIQSEQDV